MSGKPHTEEWKKKHSEQLKGHIVSFETRKKIALANKGKIVSEEKKEKLRIARSKQKDPRIGTKHSEESKLKMSLAKRGDKSPTWKGGISSANAMIRASREYKLWREAILERDNYTCIWCGSKENIQTDHIKPFALFPELRFAIDNGRTLCKLCHLTTDTYGGRSRK